MAGASRGLIRFLQADVIGGTPWHRTCIFDGPVLAVFIRLDNEGYYGRKLFASTFNLSVHRYHIQPVCAAYISLRVWGGGHRLGIAV